MKIVKDLEIGGKEITRSGCFCSSGSINTRGPWHPFYCCNCSCNYGKKNQADNKARAD